MARRAEAATRFPSLGFGPESVLAAVNERTRARRPVQPQRPDGRAAEHRRPLRALLEALPERVVVLLDEALRDFVDAEQRDATLALLEDHPRLLVFRTFSKAWGLAGLRCGYAIGGPGAEPLLEQLAPELGLNELAQAGALEALRSGEALVAGRAAGVAAERRRLMAELDRSSASTSTRSQANVLWLRADGFDGAELADRLQRHGVIVQRGGPLGDAAPRARHRARSRGGRPLRRSADTRRRWARLRSPRGG